MTMHGEIKVNDVVFGTWAASRVGNEFNYDCSYEWRAHDGYMYDAVWTMSHDHLYGGPLAAHVIAEGHKRMKRRRYVDD